MMQKIRSFIFSHKKTCISISLIVIVCAYFLLRGKKVVQARYVTATVEKGTVVSSVSGSGQVEATNTIDLKMKASGEIAYIGAKPGDMVRKGKVLVAVSARDAQKAVRDAVNALESAQLDLEKFKEPPKTVDIMTLENAISNAEKSKETAEQNVKDAYRAVLNSLIVAVPANTSSTETAPTISGTYIKDQEAMLTVSVYQGGSGSYYSVSSNPAGLVSGNGPIATSSPQALGDSGLYIKFASTNPTQNSWIITLPNKSAQNYAANLTAYTKAQEDRDKTIADADLTIAQNKQKISDLSTPDPLDLRVKELAVRQREDSLTDAQAALSDYSVVAPFDGKIASITAKMGDIASGSLGTIITNQKIATITLNEVDVSKVKLGQKATLTFDALQDVTMTGEVAEIDAVGAVAQGVVSYNVKISFDTDNQQIKPGMSVSASIVTDIKQNVLTIPTSAIKTGANGSYVEMFNTPIDENGNTQGVTTEEKPVQIPIEIGLEGDSSVEVISGLTEGEQIISRTITGTATTKAATNTPSLIGGGGSFRAVTR